MFQLGELVLTEDPWGIGEIVGMAQSHGEAWTWGALTFPRGPYVVNLGVALEGFSESRLTKPSWDNLHALRRVWQAVFPGGVRR